MDLVPSKPVRPWLALCCMEPDMAGRVELCANRAWVRPSSLPAGLSCASHGWCTCAAPWKGVGGPRGRIRDACGTRRARTGRIPLGMVEQHDAATENRRPK